MVFEGLSERLQETLGKLTGKGKLSEKDIDAAMREIRLSLLEADVNYKVVKDFVKTIKERSLGQDVMTSLSRRNSSCYEKRRSWCWTKRYW